VDGLGILDGLTSGWFGGSESFRELHYRLH